MLGFVFLLLLVAWLAGAVLIASWLKRRREIVDEHFERFMLPHILRLRAMRVEQDDIETLIMIAYCTPDPTVSGQAPGSRLRDMTDQIVEGRPVGEVIAAWSS